MIPDFPDIGAPDWGFSYDPQANVKKVTLGDGYEVRRPDGINHLKERWRPVWSNLSEPLAEYVYAWLKERLNWAAFMWTNPDNGVRYKVLCTAVSLEKKGWNEVTLTASFEQDFNPV